MIKWTKVRTFKNYPFKAYRTKKGYGNVMLLTEDTKAIEEIVSRCHMSLTNKMEEVIDHIVIGESFGSDNYTNIKFYQWCEGEGLFEVIPWWVKKITRDMPPMKINKIDWKFISKDLKAFEVLYCD